MILLQIISIFFALALAAHNAPSVSQFEYGGVRNLWMARFHRYGAWTRAFFVVAVSVRQIQMGPAEALETIYRGLLSFFWVYLVFGPALNRMRVPARSWDYVGVNDADGRRWRAWFGEKAGEAKAVILIVLIAAGNFLYYCKCL